MTQKLEQEAAHFGLFFEKKGRRGIHLTVPATGEVFVAGNLMDALIFFEGFKAGIKKGQQSEGDW